MSVAGIPGKIIVRSFSLINDFGTSSSNIIDIYPLVVGTSIYEGIFDPVMHGIAKIRDSNNLYSTLPITRDTFVKIVLQDPTTGKVVSGLYRIYKVSDIEQETPKIQTYIIHFISVEMFNMRRVRISKHVKGNIPNEIKSLHEQISSKAISISEDATKANVFIPFLTGNQALNLLLSNAKWRSSIPDYCYWETFNNFNCKSLMACSLESPIHDFSTSTPMSGNIYNTFNYSDFIKIDEIIGDQNFDSLDTLYSGADGATIYAYNPLEGSCNITMIGEQPLSKVYTFSSDSLDYKNLSKRNQILQNITSTYYYIRVPGLLSRSSGDMANVKVYNGNNMNILDTTLSGRRLICGIVHVISRDEYYQNITLGDYVLPSETQA